MAKSEHTELPYARTLEYWITPWTDRDFKIVFTIISIGVLVMIGLMLVIKPTSTSTAQVYHVKAYHASDSSVYATRAEAMQHDLWSKFFFLAHDWDSHTAWNMERHHRQIIQMVAATYGREYVIGLVDSVGIDRDGDD